MKFLKKMEKAAQLLETALKLGADNADIGVRYYQAKNAVTAMGKIEKLETSQEEDYNLRVFIGKKIANIRCNFIEDSTVLAEKVLAMAKNSPDNPFERVLDKGETVKTPKELFLFDETPLTNDQLLEVCQEMEEAALDVPSITKISASTVSYSHNYYGLLTSKGFRNFYKKSNHNRSISVIAQDGDKMERDYEYSSCLFLKDSQNASLIGKQAAHYAKQRLGSRVIPSQKIDVIFSAHMAQSLIGHLVQAINGQAILNHTSLLKGQLGKKIAGEDITILDTPLLEKGLASRPFDAEGVEGIPFYILKEGVLGGWLLSSSLAEGLGLRTNGRAIRSSLTMQAASSTIVCQAGKLTKDTMISQIKKGFFVTELFGHGIDLVTGQYSRGAAGFIIENGQISFPVSGVTLAGSLQDMWQRMIFADDVLCHEKINTPSILIEEMTLAGS